MTDVSHVKLPSTECNWILLMISQQAITWANIDPDICCPMVSLGHNELKQSANHYAC